jgi:WD40 repeat protein
MGLFNFDEAFKNNSGITVDQFDEDWRRHMNTYYYGYRAQKEAIEEIGSVVTLPIERLYGFSFYSDSTQIAITGLDDKGQGDMSLYILERDTTKEREAREERKKAKEETEKDAESKPGFFAKLFGKDEEDNKQEKKPKPIIIWDKEEVDFGSFHKYMNWSYDGRKLVYAKYHFGEHQAMINDIKVYDLDEKSSAWLTQSERSTYPDWSPDGQRIIYVAHENSVANLYTMSTDGSDKKRITNYVYDTQILNPHYSPDGNSIVFAMADKEANLDLFILELASGDIRRLTDDPAADYDPVWHPDGDFVSYTSHASSTPNIHTINLSTGASKQVSDVGDAVWTAQLSPVDSTIMAFTLPDVDTVRIVNVDPHRDVTTQALVIRDHYSDWRSAGPDILLTGVDPKKEINILKSHDYTPTIGIKHMTTLVLPLGYEVLGLTQWSDAMVRHLFIGIGLADFSENGTHRFLIQYANAMGGPLWGITATSLLDIKAKPYDRTKWGLLEENKSIALWANMPYNTGNNMSSNHTFGGSVKFTDRNANVIKDVDDETDKLIYLDSTDFRYLNMPVSGKEGLINLSYTWLSRRPHKRNAMIPKQGQGLDLTLEYANSGLYGVFDYTRITTDVFINLLPHKKSPVVIFGRIKSVTILGDKPPPQDMPAITNDTPIYMGGSNILGSDEVIHLRGWDDWRLGDRLVFGTFESRIGAPQASLAAFLDFGNAWYADGEKADWLFTGGYELRINIGFIVLAYGTAQDFNRWRESESPNNYLRMTLVNPF